MDLHGIPLVHLVIYRYSRPHRFFHSIPPTLPAYYNTPPSEVATNSVPRVFVRHLSGFNHLPQSTNPASTHCLAAVWRDKTAVVACRTIQLHFLRRSTSLSRTNQRKKKPVVQVSWLRKEGASGVDLRSYHFNPSRRPTLYLRIPPESREPHQALRTLAHCNNP